MWEEWNLCRCRDVRRPEWSRSAGLAPCRICLSRRTSLPAGADRCDSSRSRLWSCATSCTAVGPPGICTGRRTVLFRTPTEKYANIITLSSLLSHYNFASISVSIILFLFTHNVTTGYVSGFSIKSAFGVVWISGHFLANCATITTWNMPPY